MFYWPNRPTFAGDPKVQVETSGKWQQRDCFPGLKTPCADAWCKDEDCQKHSKEQQKLNPGQNPNDSDMFRHNISMCPFKVAKSTQLLNAPEIKSLGQAAVVLRRMHAKIWTEAPFGKNSEYYDAYKNNENNATSHQKLKDAQKAGGVLVAGKPPSGWKGSRPRGK